MRKTRNRAKTALTIGTLAIGIAFGVAGFGASAQADGPRGHGKSQQGSYKQGHGKSAYGYNRSGKQAYRNKPGYHGKKANRGYKRGYKQGYKNGYKYRYKGAYKHHGGRKPVQKHVYRKKGGHYGYRYGPYYKGPAFGVFFGYPVGYFGPAPFRHGGYKYYGRQYCHPVTKIGYDEYGRRIKFGGTMCYDNYGAAYILRGSKHIIHYY